MFDIGWQELFLIAVVALIVIGPKDMPAAMRTMARALAKIRSLSREFQQGVSEIMREAELDEIRRKVDEAGRIDVKGEVDRMLDPNGRLRSDFDLASDLRPTFPGENPGAGANEGDQRGATAPAPAAMASRSAYAAASAPTPAVAASPSGADANPPAAVSPIPTPPADRSPESGKVEP